MVTTSRSALLAATICAALPLLASGQVAPATGSVGAGKSRGGPSLPQTISNGAISVTVSPMGLITNVSPDGLIPTYGPMVKIAPIAPTGSTPSGITEWFGVMFDTPTGHVSASASDLQPDYAGRTPVQFVSFQATASEAVSVTRIGDIEIRTTISFNPQGPHVLLSMDLFNLGTVEVRDIMVSREWKVCDPKATSFPIDWAMMMPPAPADVHRLLYMPNNLLPGHRQGIALALLPGGNPSLPAAVDVPLQKWTSATFPGGVDFGATFGISFGDIDHDGWIDVFPCAAQRLWRNFDGTDWKRVGNIGSLFGLSEFNYGSAIADYDNDNLPDIGTEPRGNCMHLFQNLGHRQFQDVGGDPVIVDTQPCNASSETLCTADTDGDTFVDWFLPTYPPSLGSTGNWFLQNLGPAGPAGEYIFHEDSAAAGLDNPPSVNRPEGAGFVDFDGDGDSDLYSNGTLYRNISTPGTPLFEPMTEVGTGIIHSDILDEGAGFLDYDMDGDFDICIAFCDTNLGVRMYEAYGDGSYLLTKKTMFDSYNTGLCLGLSWEDWDNDGDLDVTSSEVFRRNQFVETGLRGFTVATHNINANEITDATPAWGDFDHDGDLDSALGNWGSNGHLYENTLYDSTTPPDQRRYVRIKPVRDSIIHDDGLESEWGAIVSVHPLGNSDDGLKRVKVVSSANGYLNQNEYTLHFALPPDPDPTDPAVDLDFEVTVDFKGASNQGFPRVDRHVNPVLGAIRLADLTDREIVVYRSGRVRIDGCDFVPAAPALPLTTTSGGLLAPGVNSPIAPLVGSPAVDWFAGTEISTAGAATAQRVEELILDGQLDVAVACSGPAGNVFVWDVTTAGSPVLVSDGLIERNTLVRNNRHFLPLDVTFAPNRLYRIVARVTFLRATPITAPVVDGPFTTNGGLSFADSTPCTGAGAAAAIVDPGNVYLSVRFRDEPQSAWADLGNGLAGGLGVPTLAGTGNLTSGSSTTIDLSNAAVSAPTVLVLGTATDCLSFAGGVIVPSLDLLLAGLSTDAAGHAALTGNWPSGVPGGFTIYSQALVLDATAPHGIAISNAIAGTAPY